MMATIILTFCLHQNGDGNDCQIDVIFTNINDFVFATSIIILYRLKSRVTSPRQREVSMFYLKLQEKLMKKTGAFRKKDLMN
jgi:hypothetical protein